MISSSSAVSLLMFGTAEGKIELFVLPLFVALMKNPAVGSSKWTSRQEISPEILQEED